MTIIMLVSNVKKVLDTSGLAALLCLLLELLLVVLVSIVVGMVILRLVPSIRTTLAIVLLGKPLLVVIVARPQMVLLMNSASA
jgi:hypothetical protein